MTTATRKRESMKVLEAVYSAPGKVDRDAGVIRGVKILGKQSRNGREYSEQAMREAAPLYEGMRVNIDHPTKQAIKAPRGTLEQWGWLEGVSVRDGEVFGDLHYLKSHPHTEPLLELAERRPDKFGLSHNADCSGYHAGNKTIIESVENVRSVDVVQRPATTCGLFEHEEEEPMKTTIKAVLTNLPENTRGRKQLLACLEMDGMADMGAVAMEAPAADAAPEDQVWEAFRTAVISILDNNDLSMDDTIKQMSEVLAKYEESFGKGGTTATTEEKTVPATEGIDELRRELKALKAENKAMAVLEQQDIQATPGRVKAVVSVLESASDLKEVLDSFPKRKASTEQTTHSTKKPVRSAPALEQTDDSARSSCSWKDAKEFASLVR